MRVSLGLGNKVYDVLKFIALIGLPSLTTLYFVLGDIWNLPDVQQVIGSLTAIDTFLGAILGLSSKSYSPPADGTLMVDNSHPDVMGMQMQFHTPQEEMAQKSMVHLKVQSTPLPASPIPGPHGGDA
jgi:hypothetical protein